MSRALSLRLIPQRLPTLLASSELLLTQLMTLLRLAIDGLLLLEGTHVILQTR